MKGSIAQRGKHSWEVRVDLGADPETHKRRRRIETIKGPKREAQRRLAELLVDSNRGTLAVRPGRLTVRDLLAAWLDGYVTTNCSVRTQDSYRSIVDTHLNPGIGHILLKNLQPTDIQRYYSSVLNEKGLSPRTVHHQHRVLSEALKYGVKQGWLVRNPCEMTDPPRPRKTPMKTLTPEEVGVLLEAAKTSPFYPAIVAAVNSGLRQGELLGLRWRDVNLDLAFFSVSQVLYKRRGVCEFKEPKSDHSRRKVNLTPTLALFLRQHRNERGAEALKLGRLLTLDDLVFSDAKGRPVEPGSLTHAFRKTADSVGLKCRFHDLRHTFASLMLMAGANAKVVSEALGHSSVGFTLDTYSHLLPTMQKTAMSNLDKLLAPTMPQVENVSNLSATFDNSLGEKRSQREDLNPRPAVYETAALPLSYAGS
jgi:integrase